MKQCLTNDSVSWWLRYNIWESHKVKMVQRNVIRFDSRELGHSHKHKSILMISFPKMGIILSDQQFVNQISASFHKLIFKNREQGPLNSCLNFDTLYKITKWIRIKNKYINVELKWRTFEKTTLWKWISTFSSKRRNSIPLTSPLFLMLGTFQRWTILARNLQSTFPGRISPMVQIFVFILYENRWRIL